MSKNMFLESKAVQAVRERSDTESVHSITPFTGNQYTYDELVKIFEFSPTVIQWSFTLCLMPFKKIGNKKYCSYQAIDQRTLLDKGIARAIEGLDIDPHYTYELTEKMDVHLHGSFHSSGITALLFQANCKTEFGYKNNDAQRLCCLKPSFINTETQGYSNWREYMLKLSPAGPFGGLTLTQLNTNMFL